MPQCYRFDVYTAVRYSISWLALSAVISTDKGQIRYS